METYSLNTVFKTKNKSGHEIELIVSINIFELFAYINNIKGFYDCSFDVEKTRELIFDIISLELRNDTYFDELNSELLERIITRNIINAIENKKHKQTERIIKTTYKYEV
jgi:hypothetical protein